VARPASALPRRPAMRWRLPRKRIFPSPVRGTGSCRQRPEESMPHPGVDSSGTGRRNQAEVIVLQDLPDQPEWSVRGRAGYSLSSFGGNFPLFSGFWSCEFRWSM